MKILIVEDDPTTAEIMKIVVREHGEFRHAANGQLGYDLYCDAYEQEEPFDLIFMDIMMPVADGQEALAAIRQFEEENGLSQAEGVQVVMLSCIDDPIEVYEALSSGAIEYLTKPIERKKVESVIDRVKASKELSH